MSIPVKSVVDMGGFGIINLPDPSAAQDVATKHYVDTTSGGGSSSLAGLTDVTLTSPGAGQFLEYNGTKWVNHTLVAGDIPSIAESQVTNLVTDLAAKAPLVSPALTGTPTAPTATLGTNTTQLATTAFVQAALAGGTDTDSLATLSDVLLTSLASSQFLQYNGTKWVNHTLVAGDIPNLDASKITTGQLALARGGTASDLSATGGGSQVLKQQTSGATITVGRLAITDLSDGVSVVKTPITMQQVSYYYVPSAIAKSAGGAGSQDNSHGAGNGLTDVQGSTWSISATTFLLTGVTDTTDGSQFKRDQLTFPSASTPSGLNQTVVLDMDSTSVANIFVMLRRQSATTSYFIGCNNASSAGAAAQILVYNSGTLVTSSTGSVSNYVAGHILRITATVSGSSPTTITCTVYDVTAGLVISTTTLSDSTSALQTASAGAIAIGNNAGAAVAQNAYIKQFLAYDQTAVPVPNFVAFGIDSQTYGQYVSDVNTNGGTILGNNPAAQALTNLGSSWTGVNLGNQGQQLAQLTSFISNQLPAVQSGRERHWYVLMGGINDINSGASAATVEANIKTLCSLIRARGYLVLVTTILPEGSPWTGFAANNIVSAAVNTWLITNWKTFADGLVDIAGDSRLSTVTGTYYNADGLHLNDTGSAAVGSLVATALQQAAYLPANGVTPGSYTNTNLTVDATGRVTSASNGSGGGGSASLSPIYPLPPITATGSGTWNTAAFPTGLTLFIRLSGRKIFNGCAQFKIGLVVDAANLVIANAIIRKTNLESTTWVDAGTNITWGSSATPTFTTTGEQISDLITYSITPDYDYYVLVDINRSTTTGRGKLLAYAAANDVITALATGFTTNGTDTTAAASAANFTGNGNYFFVRWEGQ